MLDSILSVNYLKSQIVFNTISNNITNETLVY